MRRAFVTQSVAAVFALGFATTTAHAGAILGTFDTTPIPGKTIWDVFPERIPEDFALVMRTLILLNGLSHRLSPGRRLIQGELIQHLA